MYWQLSSGNAFFWHCLHSTVANNTVFPCVEFVQFTTSATGHLNMRVQVLHSVQVCMGRAGPSNSGSTPDCEKTRYRCAGRACFKSCIRRKTFGCDSEGEFVCGAEVVDSEFERLNLWEATDHGTLHDMTLSEHVNGISWTSLIYVLNSDKGLCPALRQAPEVPHCSCPAHDINSK